MPVLAQAARPSPMSVGQVEHRSPDRTALADVGHPAVVRQGPVGGGGEGRDDAGRRVQEALAVGAEHADTGLAGHRGEPLLQGRALGTDLGEARGVDDGGRRPDRGGLPDGVLHPVRGDQHQHQVDRARDVGQRRVALLPDQLLVVRVDRVDAALVAVLHEVAQRPGHQVLGAAGDPEQRDAAGPEQRLQAVGPTALRGLRGGIGRRHGHRAAPSGRATGGGVSS